MKRPRNHTGSRPSQGPAPHGRWPEVWRAAPVGRRVHHREATGHPTETETHPRHPIRAVRRATDPRGTRGAEAMSRIEGKAVPLSGLRTLNVTRSVHLSIGCMSSVDIHAPPSGLGRPHLHCQNAERWDGSQIRSD